MFTLIVLGESILADTAGFQAAIDAGGLTARLLTLGVSGLLIAFAAWWIYFDHPGHLTPTPSQSFRWGYAHVILLGVTAPVTATMVGSAAVIVFLASSMVVTDLRRPMLTRGAA